MGRGQIPCHRFTHSSFSIHEFGIIVIWVKTVVFM